MKPNINYIRKEMDRRKWTGSQLAMKMGVSRMEVSRLLRGKRVGGKKCIGGLIKAFPDADFNDLFFWIKRNLLFPQKGAAMEQIKNLDDKRVCDKSKDGKVIEIRKKNCITRITANVDRTLKVTHEYVK